MQIAIRKMGNSKGVLIPKPLLQQVGFEDSAEISVEGNALILRPARPAVRTGWAEASQRIAAANDDALALPDFTNEGDNDWAW